MIRLQRVTKWPDWNFGTVKAVSQNLHTQRMRHVKHVAMRSGQSEHAIRPIRTHVQRCGRSHYGSKWTCLPGVFGVVVKRCGGVGTTFGLSDFV
jgi:hypothetical protein